MLSQLAGTKTVALPKDGAGVAIQADDRAGRLGMAYLMVQNHKLKYGGRKKSERPDGRPDNSVPSITPIVL